MVHLALAAKLAVQVVVETLKSPVVEITMLVSATLWLLAKVNTCAGLLVPTVSAGKVLPAGVSVAGTVPVPVRLEVCGLPIALSLTCNVPFLVPVAVGVNATLMVHLALAAKLAVQVVVDTLKSPVVEITMLVSATFCVLATVNTCAGLLVPTVSAGKILLAGVSVA